LFTDPQDLWKDFETTVPHDRRQEVRQALIDHYKSCKLPSIPAVDAKLEKLLENKPEAYENPAVYKANVTLALGIVRALPHYKKEDLPELILGKDPLMPQALVKKTIDDMGVVNHAELFSLIMTAFRIRDIRWACIRHARRWDDE